MVTPAGSRLGAAAGFGKLPAAPVVATAYALFFVGVAVLPDSGADAVGVVLPAMLALYAWLRSTDRLDVLMLAYAPAIASRLLAEVGAPLWVGWLLAPVVLVVLVEIDGRRRRGTPEPPPT